MKKKKRGTVMSKMFAASYGKKQPDDPYFSKELTKVCEVCHGSGRVGCTDGVRSGTAVCIVCGGRGMV